VTTAADPLADLYDHEVRAIIDVHMALRERYQERVCSIPSFENEATQRFAEAGFTIAIGWHEYSVGGVRQEGALPEITITGRVAPGFQFDQDRQVHEVTSNLLGIPGEDGVIKTDPDTLRNFLGDQDHGHDHHH
jgi:hypothetical protein